MTPERQLGLDLVRELIQLVDQHGSRSEEVRQFVIAHREDDIGDGIFATLACGYILVHEASEEDNDN